MNNKTCGECRHFRKEDFKNMCLCKDQQREACADFEPLTNGGRIREMDTSGLIDVIVCPYPDKDCIHRTMNGYACKCCKRDWLNAPAEMKEIENEC